MEFVFYNWFHIFLLQASSKVMHIIDNTLFISLNCFLADYSCALQRDILVHGRLYISQNWLCFYANIFGWETFVSILYSNAKLIIIHVVPENVHTHSKEGWGRISKPNCLKESVKKSLNFQRDLGGGGGSNSSLGGVWIFSWTTHFINLVSRHLLKLVLVCYTSGHNTMYRDKQYKEREDCSGDTKCCSSLYRDWKGV